MLSALTCLPGQTTKRPHDTRDPDDRGSEWHNRHPSDCAAEVSGNCIREQGRDPVPGEDYANEEHDKHDQNLVSHVLMFPSL